jgi:hypothetical protein
MMDTESQNLKKKFTHRLFGVTVTDSITEWLSDTHNILSLERLAIQRIMVLYFIDLIDMFLFTHLHAHAQELLGQKFFRCSVFMVEYIQLC